MNYYQKLYITILNFAFAFCSAQNTQQNAIQAIENYKKQDTTKVEMIVDFCTSNTFSNSDKVLFYAKQALEISNKIKYKLGKIRALNCVGNYYYQQASYEKAVENYNLALSIAEKSNDIQNQIIGKSNLASLYTRIHQEQKALALFREADSLLVASNQEESQNRAAVLTNIGMAYSSLKQHQKAVDYHKKTLEICVKKNIIFGVALAKSNIGEEYIRLKKTDVALPFIIDAKTISEKEGYDNFLSQIYKNLAEINLLEKQAQKAILMLQKAIAVAKKIDDKNALLSATQILQETYFKEKDFKNAYLQSVDFFSINEQINGLDKQKMISEVNTKYETEKRQTQILQLSQSKKIADLQNKQQKAYLVLLVFAIISILISSFLLFKRYKTQKATELLKVQLAETQKTLLAENKATESELKALKSQMNPHFIFNALNGIQEQFMYGDKLLANEQMGNFTSLTRQILSVSGKKTITLDEEIDLLTKYLELEKMRFQDDFYYDITIGETIDTDYHQIPPMIVQPFVENAIKHGLLHKKDEKKVTIHFELSNAEEFLVCTIIDNGIGRTASSKIKENSTITHQSFSTLAIEERLKLLVDDQQNEDLIVYKDIFDAENNVAGTKVVVQIAIL